MEIVSPVCFLTTFLSSPLTRPASSLKWFRLSPPPMFSQTSFAGVRFSGPNPPTVLALLFLVHYANRALISPLRTPARSKSHIAVPLAAICFNIVNGSLQGAFLAALAAPPGTFSSFGIAWFRGNNSVIANWKFWAGVGIWAVGFVSNIWHDEILLDIRRDKKPSGSEKRSALDKENGRPIKETKPHYAIPYGGLYAVISYPNYFSEWIEWLGFAMAASALTSQLPSTHLVFPFAAGRLGLGKSLSVLDIVTSSDCHPFLSIGALSNLPFVQNITPPWIFFLSEIFLMCPRAWNGHKWYHNTLPDYPRQRKAVVPFLF